MEEPGGGELSFRGAAPMAEPEAQDAAVQPAAVVRKLNRHLIPWLFSLGVLCYLDRTNLAFAALELNRTLAFSCSAYGLGAAMFFISYAMFQIPSTVACRHLGAPTWLAASIICWGVVAASFALMDDVPSFLALRFLLGATESAAFPGMWYHLSTFYSEDELGPAYAKVASSTALAQVVGAPLAAAILSMDGVGYLRGWQWLFLLEGGATVIFGIALRCFLAPSPAKARVLSHAEREWLAQRQAEAQAAASAAAARQNPHNRGTLGVVRNWRVLWLATCWLLIAATMYGIIFWLPLLVSAMFSGSDAASGAAGGAHHGAACGGSHDSSDDNGQGAAPEQQQAHTVLVALATAVPFIAAACGMTINARLAERANERHRHAGVPLLLAGGVLALVPLALRVIGPVPAFVLLSLAAALCWAFHGPFFSWPAVFLAPDQAAAGFAFINTLGAAGGFIGPYALGLLTDREDGGLVPVFLMLAAFLATSGTLILMFPAPGHREKWEAVDSGDASLKGAPGIDGGEEGGPAEREPQQQQQRHKGGSSRQAGELECQPILPSASSRSA